MTDNTYATASAVALGRSIADVFHGLIEGGMKRDEALEVVIEYVRALLGSRSTEPTDDAS